MEIIVVILTAIPPAAAQGRSPLSGLLPFAR